MTWITCIWKRCSWFTKDRKNIVWYFFCLLNFFSSSVGLNHRKFPLHYKVYKLNYTENTATETWHLVSSLAGPRWVGICWATLCFPVDSHMHYSYPSRYRPKILGINLKLIITYLKLKKKYLICTLCVYVCLYQQDQKNLVQLKRNRRKNYLSDSPTCSISPPLHQQQAFNCYKHVNK